MKRFSSLVLIISILFYSCNRENKNSTPPSGMIKDYPVLTLTAVSDTVHQDFPATIEGQQVIEIRPMISGYIQEIYVNEGDHVKKGQLLFRIRNPMYEQQVNTAKASISRAEADVNTARMEIDKVKPLVDKQIVSEYRLRTAELQLESRQAALEQARAELANAEANLAYTIIRSPQDGIIGMIPFKTGALVNSNMTQPLTTLSDITNVFAYFSWNEKQLLDFLSHSPGESMEDKMKNIPAATLILANATEYPEKGRIEMASGLISTETGSAIFKAVFPNNNGLIRSGSSATIRVPEVLDSVLMVPQSATYELQDKRFIYKVGEGNKVSAVSITATPSDDGRHFLVTDGLASGDRVVIEGVTSLKEGTEIIPRDTLQVISGI